MFKEQKGITLVALVITIIVLLILAGVSISLVVGQEGVLGRAQNAVSETEVATVDQEIQLAIADAQIAYFDAWSNNQVAQKKDYFGDIKYYTNNCVGAISGTVKINGDAVKSSTAADSENEVIVLYTSNSNIKYMATFKIGSPSTTFQLADLTNKKYVSGSKKGNDVSEDEVNKAKTLE